MSFPWFQLLGSLALIMALAVPAAAGPLTGGDIAAAVAAIRTDTPTPAQKKVVDLVLHTMLREHYKKLGITESRATPQIQAQLNQASRLTLMTVAAMTTHDPATARQFSLEDLMAISGVVMRKIRDMKIIPEKLQDQRFLVDTFIPEVIEELAK